MDHASSNFLTDDTFEFFMPVEAIQKSETSDKKDTKRWIQGIASTADLDLQGEKVLQNGIDTGYFLKHGYINDDHKPGPENKVGEPTEARITKAGLWIKGFLFKGQENSDKWWSFLNALDQSDSTRKVGFSIQGKVTRRSGNSIVKCWLQDIAITASPVNTNTWAEIVKALNTQRWCAHPWRSIEKACKGCPGKGNSLCPNHVGPPGETLRKEDEHSCSCEGKSCSCGEKALAAGGQGRVLVPQSLEGGEPKIQTFKALERLSYDDAIRYLSLEKGYSKQTARFLTESIFAHHGLH